MIPEATQEHTSSLELFWSICLKNSCCFMWKRLESLDKPKSNQRHMGTDHEVPALPHPTTLLTQPPRTPCPAPFPAQESSTCERPFQVTLCQRFTLGIFCLFPSSHPCIIQGHKEFGENLTASNPMCPSTGGSGKLET